MARLNLEPPPERSYEIELQRADASTNTGPLVPTDRLARRIGAALCVSILINVGLWTLLSGVVRSHIIAPPRPLTFKLVTLPPPPKHKRIKPPEPPKKKSVQKAVIAPKTAAYRRPTRTLPPQHNRVLTATGSTQSAGTAAPGGNAQAGAPIVQQPAPAQAGTTPAPAPVAAPPPVKPPPAAPKPAPKAEAPPAPSGPTQDAEPESQIRPVIPDDLLNEDFKSFVRVKVDIAADGSSIPVLVTSSGDAGIDQLVLQALKQWKWKPALANGVPVASSQRFRFNFTVE